MTEEDAGYLERHEAFVRGNRIFFLGAGFSAAAGVPLTGTLLSSAMGLFASECPGLYSRVEGYARDAFSIPRSSASPVDYSQLSFADLCTFIEYIELKEFGGGERWNDSGCREKLALKFYLSLAVARATPIAGQIPVLYLDFARQLRPTDLVVTFNWDCLLEAALIEVGVPFRYPSMANGTAGSEPCVEVTKLHGSVNWRLGLPRCEAEFNWIGLGFTNGMMSEDVYFSNKASDSRLWNPTAPLGEIEPMIVLPGSGKAFDVRHLAPLWYKPENAFGYTHDVHIIGLSLADDDFFIRSFFLSTLPRLEALSGVAGRRICIINPDERVRGNYAFLEGQGNVDFRCEPFDESHIALFTSSDR